MMIILNEHDVRRLSPEFQLELQRLFFEKASEPQAQPEDLFMFDAPPEEYSTEQSEGLDADAKDGKRVIDISVEDAKALIANISAKSLQTLELFAAGNPIALDKLIGPEQPYENLTDLKRSFIGAVTRRLRTVTRNKQAALFLQTTSAPDNAATAIAIRPISAVALRVAMNLNIEAEGA